MQRLDEIAAPMQVEKGEILFGKNAFPAALYVVASGLFKISVRAPDWREQVLYFAPEGVPIVESYLPGELTTRVTVTAELPSSVWRLATDRLTVLAEESAPLALALIRLFAFRLVRRDSIIESKTGLTVNARLAGFLLEKVRGIPDGEPLVIPRLLSGDQAGARLGAARTELSRALARLRDLRILSFTAKEITILDLAKLKTIALKG